VGISKLAVPQASCSLFGESKLLLEAEKCDMMCMPLIWSVAQRNMCAPEQHVQLVSSLSRFSERRREISRTVCVLLWFAGLQSCSASVCLRA
jgi:hypothetical protein